MPRVLTLLSTPMWVCLRSTGWRLPQSQELARFEGRIKIAYLGCSRDRIVLGDRELMGKYVEGFNASAVNQMGEMWDFLTTTHKCAPLGTILSYVMDCQEHHLTNTQGQSWAKGFDHREGDRWKSVGGLPNAPPVRTFVANFFEDLPPDATDTDRHHFWFEDHNIDARGSQCAKVAEEVSGVVSIFGVAMAIHLALAARLCFTL